MASVHKKHAPTKVELQEPENEYERLRFLQMQKLKGALESMVQPALNNINEMK
eukprot:gene25069-10720_t